MEMYSRLNSVNDSSLSDLEQKSGIRIPESYRKFLINDSGGQPRKNNFYKELSSGGVFDFEIDTFLGVSEDLSFNIFHTYSIMLGVIPSNLLTIAYDGIGNKICIGLEVQRLGQIYIWWSDKNTSSHGKPDFKNVEFLAGSWSDFISHLQ